MSQRLFLGIDVGTTSTRALLIDERGAIRGDAASEYSFQSPRPLWAEQDPATWRSAALAAVRGAISRATAESRDIAAVGVSGQMHGLVLLDAGLNVLRPAILWNDQRTGEQCAEITRRVGRQRVLELTGNAVLPGFTAPKLLWVRQNEPAVYARIAHILLPKDYVRFCLSGKLHGDVTDCSGTSLFDVAARRWSPQMGSACEIPASWLPDVAESPIVVATVSKDAAAETGLLEGTPIVAGAGDQAAAAIAMGAAAPGVTTVTIGTSGVVFAPTAAFLHDPQGRLHAFCHAVPGAWHCMGVMLSAAGSLRWYRESLFTSWPQGLSAGQPSYEQLCTEAAQAPAGSDGLVFLPYLCGERTPHVDPSARAAFVGLTARHGRAHLTRAVLEGVCYGLRDCLALLHLVGAGHGEIRVAGGGSRSRVWLQILADVLERPISTVETAEGSAYGAAMLAAVGVGAFDGVPTACAELVHLRDTTPPTGDFEPYRRGYASYRDLYARLQPSFAQLT